MQKIFCASCLFLLLVFSAYAQPGDLEGPRKPPFEVGFGVQGYGLNQSRGMYLSQFFLQLPLSPQLSVYAGPELLANNAGQASIETRPFGLTGGRAGLRLYSNTGRLRYHTGIHFHFSQFLKTASFTNTKDRILVHSALILSSGLQFEAGNRIFFLADFELGRNKWNDRSRAELGIGFSGGCGVRIW